MARPLPDHEYAYPDARNRRIRELEAELLQMKVNRDFWMQEAEGLREALVKYEKKKRRKK